MMDNTKADKLERRTALAGYNVDIAAFCSQRATTN